MNSAFAQLFEFWGFNMSSISDSLYDYNIYGTTGLVWLVVCIGVVLLYYFVVNNPRWSKPSHWIILMICTSLIVAGFAFFYAYRTFTFEDLGYRFEEYIHFFITVLFYSMILFFIASWILKRFSVNCSKTPF